MARALFVENGYEATSIGRLARQVGVAPNTIYWYFADKDALLIAVLDDLVAEAMAEYQTRNPRGGFDALGLWLLGVFEGVQGLIATVHARAALSEAVEQWHARFHVMFEAMLVAELRARGVAEPDLQPASRVATLVVEGLLAHPTSARDRRALVRWMVARLGV